LFLATSQQEGKQEVRRKGETGSTHLEKGGYPKIPLWDFCDDLGQIRQNKIKNQQTGVKSDDSEMMHRKEDSNFEPNWVVNSNQRSP